MKIVAILTMFIALSLNAVADPANPFENFSPHFSTNTQIIWKAPTNHLPKSFWIYQRQLPRLFSQSFISNAIVLASLQRKGFPKTSTNEFYISADSSPNDPGVIPIIFYILPNEAYIYYTAPNPGQVTADIPNSTTLVAEASKCAREFGLNPANLVRKSFSTDASNTRVIGRGVFLSRQLDGITFFSPDDQGTGAEGFFLELGSEGKVMAFSFRYSDIKPYQNLPCATPDRIIKCIMAKKIIVLPTPNDETYFEKIKKLGTATKFTITQITPYYIDGFFGEMPTNNIPLQFIAPVAEVYASADLGNSNMVVHMYCPILSSDVNRLLGN